jgi:hypothetical protein
MCLVFYLTRQLIRTRTTSTLDMAYPHNDCNYIVAHLCHHSADPETELDVAKISYSEINIAVVQLETTDATFRALTLPGLQKS